MTLIGKQKASVAAFLSRREYRTQYLIVLPTLLWGHFDKHENKGPAHDEPVRTANLIWQDAAQINELASRKVACWPD